MKLTERACDAGMGNSCVRLGRWALSGQEGVRDRTRAARFFVSGCDAPIEPGDSCFELGRLHARGFGVEASVVRAAEHFRRGCDYGSAAACGELGWLVQRGRIDGTSAEVVTFVERGCDLGSALACERRGRAAEHLLGDPEQAFGWYRRAAERYRARCEEADDDVACNGLSRLMREGSGVPQNRAGADALLVRHCGAGSPEACLNWMGRDGKLSLSSDGPDALTPLLKACVENHADACFVLGRIGDAPIMQLNKEPLNDPFGRGCRAGSGTACTAAALTRLMAAEGRTSVFPLELEVTVRLERACALGDAGGCYHLALLRQVEEQSASGEVRALYRRACDWRHPRGCHRLADVFRRGEGVAVDIEAARQMLRRACELGLADACHELSRALQRVSADASSAVELGERACRLGSRDACWRRAADALREAGSSNKTRARAELTRGCKRGHGASCLELALSYESDVHGDQDSERARKIFIRAGRLDGARCSVELDACYRQQFSADSFLLSWERWSNTPSYTIKQVPDCDVRLETLCRRAERAHAASCELGDGRGCEAGAELHEQLGAVGLREGTDAAVKMQKRARGAYEEACGRGSGFACHAQARMLADGVGGRADPRRAKQLRDKACELDRDLCGM